MQIMLQYGCDEWQDEINFDTIAEATAYVESGDPDRLSMGAYPATYAHVTSGWDDIILEFEL